MRVREAVHWGKDAYGRALLPSTEAAALKRYLRAAASNGGRGDVPAYGSNGVTVYARPVVVLGLVRGVDEAGDPTVYLVTEEPAEASQA